MATVDVSEDVDAVIEQELLALRHFFSEDILESLLSNPQLLYNLNQHDLVFLASSSTSPTPQNASDTPSSDPSSTSASNQPTLPKELPKQQQPLPHTKAQPTLPLELPKQEQTLPHSNAPAHPSRFGNPITNTKLQEAIQGRVPTNTRRSTNWGMGVWKDWCSERKVTQAVETMVPKLMCSLLAKFVQEALRKVSKEYPPSSLTNMVSGIQRHLRENGRPEVSCVCTVCE